MKLYRYRNAITVVPALDENGAIDRYHEQTDLFEPEGSAFEVIIEHNDFVKIFRLARLLNRIEHFSFEDIEIIVSEYVKRLGYSLSSAELWHGILCWAERFDDVDDEDIEDWIN